jgi:hypothetical protein
MAKTTKIVKSVAEKAGAVIADVASSPVAQAAAAAALTEVAARISGDKGPLTAAVEAVLPAGATEAGKEAIGGALGAWARGGSEEAGGQEARREETGRHPQARDHEETGDPLRREQDRPRHDDAEDGREEQRRQEHGGEEARDGGKEAGREEARRDEEARHGVEDSRPEAGRAQAGDPCGGGQEAKGEADDQALNRRMPA